MMPVLRGQVGDTRQAACRLRREAREAAAHRRTDGLPRQTARDRIETRAAPPDRAIRDLKCGTRPRAPFDQTTLAPAA